MSESSLLFTNDKVRWYKMSPNNGSFSIGYVLTIIYDEFI